MKNEKGSKNENSCQLLKIICLSIIFVNGKAFASCTSLTYPKNSLIANINMNDVSVGDMGDTSVFTSTLFNSGQLYWGFYGCSSVGSSHWFLTDLTQIATETIGSAKVFKTTNPNIFYELEARDSNNSTGWINAATNTNIRLREHVSADGWYAAYYRVKFHIKGILPAGVYSLNGILGKTVLSENQWSNNNYKSMEINYTFSVTVTPGTCELDVGDQNKIVNLPSVPISNFSGIGSVTGETPFNLNISCQAGTKAYMTFSDAYDLSNVSNNLTLSDSSSTSAKGVSIQVLSKGDPVVLKTPFYIAGENNSPAMRYAIPFLAQYAQTQSNISGGTVEAKSIVEMTYE